MYVHNGKSFDLVNFNQNDNFQRKAIILKGNPCLFAIEFFFGVFD